jgi:hypothetical protein
MRGVFGVGAMESNKGKRESMRRYVLTGGSLAASLFLVIAALVLTPTLAFASETCPNAARRAEQPFGDSLPECRAYELVSSEPALSLGQDATETNIKTRARASESGNAFTYTSHGALSGGETNIVEDQLLARRGPNGWVDENVTPPFTPGATETQSAYEASAFTPELTEAVTATTAGLDGAKETTIENGGYREQNDYRVPLSDSLSPRSYEFLGESFQPVEATADLTHILLGEFGTLSESIDGRLHVVGIGVDGTQVTASGGDAATAAQSGFNRQKDAWRAVSDEGSRVYFTSPAFEEEGEEHQLYVRLNAEKPQSALVGERCTEPENACTIEVSRSQRGTPDPNGPKPARYWGASTNGQLAYFTSAAELTKNAYTGEEEDAPTLYQYDAATNQLVDVTGEATEETSGPEVKGVVQMSEDGQYVYFVAAGALENSTKAILRNASGSEPTPGADNLYLYHNGEDRFVATLAEGDSSDWRGGNDAKVGAGPAVNSAVISDDGLYLAFMSEAELTGYDNTQAEPGDCKGVKILETGLRGNEHCREVFLYDAAANALTCVSCNPTGAQPVGEAALTHGTSFDFTEYVPRNVLNDGAVFFDSSDTLVPSADQHRENAYESRSGVISALSDVAAPFPSWFLDSSADGSDVFIATAADLIPAVDGSSENVAIYDARIGGGFPPPVGEAGCTTAESCKPPETAQASWAEPTPEFPANASVDPPVEASFVAASTKAETRAKLLDAALKACKKKRTKRGRQTCDYAAKKRLAVVRPDRASQSKQEKSR